MKLTGIGSNLPFLQKKPLVHVDLPTFVSILFNRRNQFFRIVWHSNQNSRLQKTGPGAEYKNKDVRKLYVATVRNDFSFENRVRKLCELVGAGSQAIDWTPQPRTWGENLDGLSFVQHTKEDEGITRLHGKFMPSSSKFSNSLIAKFTGYWFFPGITGYYVDGVKVDDATIKALEYKKKPKITVLDQARQAAHPVNARLDDVVAFYVGGLWYTVKPPTEACIERLAAKAAEYSAIIKAATSKKSAA